MGVDGRGMGTGWVRRTGEGGGVRVRDGRCRGCDDARSAMRGCSADFLLSSQRRARGNGRFSPKTQLSAFYGLKPPFFARFSMFFTLSLSPVVSERGLPPTRTASRALRHSSPRGSPPQYHTLTCMSDAKSDNISVRFARSRILFLFCICVRLLLLCVARRF